MPFPRATWMFALLAAAPAGCAVRGDVEMLESELRRQEQVQEQVAEELKSTREELRVARSDAENLRAQLSERGEQTLVAEQADVLYRAEALKFNAMLTSGANRDGQPGDDGVSVLLQPVDAHGDLVKLVGAIDMELLDLNREGEAQHVGRWQYTATEVREHWHRGFLSAGYLFQLDWQSPPTSSELTLHAKLTTPDGRKFDATTQVKVDPGTAPPQTLAKAKPPAAKRPGSVVQASASKADPASKAPKKLRQRTATRRVPTAKPTDERPPETSDNFTDLSIPTLR